MKSVIIEKANSLSQIGAKLNIMALDEMTTTLVGSTDHAVVEETILQMWRQPNNRFSHEFAYEAKVEGATLGTVTCLPVSRMDKLAWPTVKKLLAIRKFSLVAYALRNFAAVWSIMDLREGRSDEFHIASIATAPESRGMGVGTKLLLHAEEEARKQQFSKVSLTVKQKNTGARKLYERLGYQVTEQIDKHPFYLYRMVKLI